MPPATPPASPPPTATPACDTFSPGIKDWSPAAFRELGMASMTSSLSVCCTLTLWTSTTGVSPVTVTVSCSSPTVRSAFTVATNVPVSSMPSRFTVLKPGNGERHRIRARTQVDDAVLPGRVGGDRPHLLNQDPAGRFHRHAGQYGAGYVLDDTGNRALREGDHREEDQHGENHPRWRLRASPPPASAGATGS